MNIQSTINILIHNSRGRAASVTQDSNCNKVIQRSAKRLVRGCEKFVIALA